MMIVALTASFAHAEVFPPTIPIHLTFRDENMKPLRDAAVSGFFVQSAKVNKTMLTSVADSELPFECLTDSAGVCALQVPLRFSIGLQSFNVAGGHAISGRIRAIREGQNEPPAAVDLTIAKGVNATDISAGPINFYVTKRAGNFEVSRLFNILSPELVVTKIQPEMRGDKTFFSTFSRAISYGMFPTASAKSYLQVFIGNQTGDAKYRIVSSISFLGSMHFADHFSTLPQTTRNATYRNANQLVNFPLSRISISEDEDDHLVHEVVCFEVAESFLRTLVVDYVSGSDNIFEFFVPNNDASPLLQGIPYFEIAGMLKKATEVQTRRMQDISEKKN